MSQEPQVIAIVGSYRKGGIVDSALDEMLEAVVQAGVEVAKVYLSDLRIEFCHNCRRCTQEEGDKRGRCRLRDDMEGLLDKIEVADGIILGSPVNCFTVTALTKRFVERLVGHVYWPWGRPGPRNRNPKGGRKAVLVISCAMPGLLARPFTNALRVLKSASSLLGARQVGSLVIGGVAQKEKEVLSGRVKARARRLGRKLAASLYTKPDPELPRGVNGRTV